MKKFLVGLLALAGVMAVPRTAWSNPPILWDGNFAKIIGPSGIKLLSTKEFVDLSVNPTTTGFAASIGSVGVYNNAGAGEFYVKTGAGNTAWSKALIASPLTANRAVLTDGLGVLTTGAVTDTEVGYLSGVTSSLCGINQSCTLTGKTISGGSNTLTNIADGSLVESYLKADGTRALSADWNAGAHKITANSVQVGSAANTIAGVSTLVNGAGTLSLPSSSDVLTGRATTDTLTNKSISGSSNTLSNIGDSSLSSSYLYADGTRGLSGNWNAGAHSITASSFIGALTGNASTASALAANPADCSANQFATTIAANGDLTCAQPTVSNLSALTVSKAVETNASGILTTSSFGPATNANTASTLVARDASGNFTAGTITATLSGNASTASALAADPSDCAAGTKATAIAANGNLTCSSVDLSADTASTALPLNKGGTGQTTKAAAFDALSPNSTKGDVTVNTGSTNVRQAVGSDGQVFTADSSQTNGVKWTSLYGNVNYIPNTGLESTVTGYNTYSDGASATPVDGTGGSPSHITVARSTSSPLRGVGSLTIVNAGSTSAQGEGASYDFTIDTADEAKTLQIGFDYLVASGTFVAGSDAATGDLNVYVYDVTNAVVIQPSAYKLTCSSTTLPCAFKGTFQAASNSTSYRLIWHVASTNTAAWTLKADNITVGPQITNLGAPVTDFTSYTPTYGNANTLSITPTVKYSRHGDSIYIVGKLAIGSGAGSAATFTVSLPSGVTLNPGATIATGEAKLFDSSASDLVPLSIEVANNGTNFFFAKPADVTGNTYLQGADLGSSDELQFSLGPVPVTGWASSVSLSNDNDGRSIIASYLLNGSSSTTSLADNTVTILDYNSKLIDTTGAVTTGASWKFTAPQAGNYEVCGSLLFTGSANLAVTYLSVYKNGSEYAVVGYRSGALKEETGCAVVPLVAGDYVDVRGYQDDTASAARSISTSANYNIVTVRKISTAGQIAATDTVATEYTLSSGSCNTGAVTAISFATKIHDYTGSWATDTFTAPVSGLYRLTANLVTAAVTWTTSQSLQMNFNNNGTSEVVSLVNGNGAASLIYSTTASKEYRLTAGQTLKVEAICSTATNWNTNAGRSYATVTRVGNY